MVGAPFSPGWRLSCALPQILAGSLSTSNIFCCVATHSFTMAVAVGAAPAEHHLGAVGAPMAPALGSQELHPVLLVGVSSPGPWEVG